MEIAVSYYIADYNIKYCNRKQNVSLFKPHKSWQQLLKATARVLLLETTRNRKQISKKNFQNMSAVRVTNLRGSFNLRRTRSRFGSD